jgi:hypothetical protein
MDNAERKAQLEAWIVRSKRTRIRVIQVAAACAVAGLVVAFAVHGVIGAVITVGSVAFGLCGAWITTAHILSFSGDIKDLEAGRFEPQVVHVKQGRGMGKGRYQR